MTYSKITLSALTAASIAFTGCGGGGGASTSTTPANSVDSLLDCSTVTYTTPSGTTLAGNISAHTYLTADQTWILDGLVAVTNDTCLKIEKGTTIAGKDGTGASTSYMIVDKGSRIMAEGTADEPIIFTSEKAVNGDEPAVGQWGGLTIIGKAANPQVGPYEVNSAFVAESTDMADNSGVLKHVQVLNSGITMEQDKEINGLSLVGVGSGTVIEDIVVKRSDDDCVELWGGTVNLTNVTLSECTDDHFDIDDGYEGTVSNLNIAATIGNAGIEMSGDTSATFDGFNIVINNSKKEGAIFFKKAGIGGHFANGRVTYNVSATDGAIHSQDTFDSTNTSFSNVIIDGTTTIDEFTGDSATGIKAIFDADTSNKVVSYTTPMGATLSGNITTDMHLTNDTTWIIDGLVTVTNGADLKIEAGTTIAGKNGTGASTSYLVIDKGSKIFAEGTSNNPIIFTSEDSLTGQAAWGQWGGVTIIGNAANAQVAPYEVNSAFVAGTTNMVDSSGVLTYVEVLNSGITMEQDKEINGLSLVGAGEGTVIKNLTVNKSDDDCVELWGGTVNLTNVTLSECSDDHFDIDDGFSGTVKNLTITQTTGNAGIEMSGNTHATFDGFTITQTTSTKEGGIFFKKDGIGGHFKSGTVTDNSDDTYGAIHSQGVADIANTSFNNVTLSGSSSDATFTGDSAVALEAQFDAGSGNTK